MHGGFIRTNIRYVRSNEGTDKKTSLMMYVVKTCQQCKPDSLKWVENLEILPDARKVCL